MRSAAVPLARVREVIQRLTGKPQRTSGDMGPLDTLSWERGGEKTKSFREKGIGVQSYVRKKKIKSTLRKFWTAVGGDFSVPTG